MISFSDPRSAIFLADLSITQAANQKTESEISSGLTVAKAEDAPDQITELLRLESQQARNTQIQTNLTSTQALANAGDQALTSALEVVDQVSSAGTEGLGIGTSATTRQQLAQQVQDSLAQLVSLSQTTVGGRYVFGGDSDQSPSYQLDSSSPNGVDRLTTAGATSTIEDSNGISFQSGLSAQQIFDHRNADDSYAPDNLFAAVNSLATALSNNDTAGITNALNSVQTASTYVNTQQGFYGGLENRLTQSLAAGSNISTSLSQQVSAIRDTDLSQAAVALTQGQTALQASIEAESQPPKSLFDYLG